MSLSRVGINLEIHSQFCTGAGHQWIFRARNVGTKCGTILLYRDPHPALAKFVAARPSRTQAKSALASLQVRHAHAGEQHAGKFLGRKSYWHANHRAEDPSLAKPMPERNAAAHPL